MAEEKIFEVKGDYKTSKGLQAFTKSINALNENHAKERTFALLGSKHGLKRREIKIKEVKNQ